MKKFFASFCVSCLLLTSHLALPPATLIWPAAGIALVTSTGCKTANTTAYKVTGSAIVTVDAAMSAWGDYVRTSHPPVAQEQAVKDAYLKYQAAASAVTSAGAAHARILATQGPDEKGALAALNAAIAIASASLNDLITLVQRFGGKI